MMRFVFDDTCEWRCIIIIVLHLALRTVEE